MENLQTSDMKINITLNILAGTAMSTRSGSHTSRIRWQRAAGQSLCSLESQFSIKGERFSAF